MKPDEIAEKISGLLKADYFHFDPDTDTVDGVKGNLVFCARNSGDVFFLPLVVGKRIAEYIDIVSQLQEAYEDQGKAADKLITHQNQQVETLKIQEEMRLLDEVDVAVANGAGPEIDFSRFYSGKE